MWSSIQLLPYLLLALLLGYTIRYCQGFRPPFRRPQERASKQALLIPFKDCLRPLFSADENVSSTSVVGERPRARGSSGTLRLKELLQRRLLFVVETVGGIDRAALFLTRCDLVGDGVELFPAVAFPSTEENWMLTQVAAVQPKKRTGRNGNSSTPLTFFLPSGELAVRISHGSQLVAVLVVDDEKRRKTRRRQKDGSPSREAELKLSAARMGRIEEVASRVFGTVLKDALVSDQQALAAESVSSSGLIRTEVLPFIGTVPGEAARPPPGSPEAITAAYQSELARIETETFTSATLAKANLNANASSSSILSSDVTISVGGATNITFDLHLLEDFKHIFDDIQLSGISLENNTNLFILQVAAPVVAALALEPLISLVDTYYIGHFLGSVSLSAYGISERVFVFSLYILNFLATSTTPIVANLRAQGEDEAARELVGRLLFFAGMLGLALIPILQTLSYPLLNLLGARPENYAEAVEYFQVRSWGTPALMLVAVSNGALRGYLDTSTPLIIAAIAFVVDYSVNPELVYPADPKGLGAAGAATVISEWLSAGLFLTKFLTMKPPILLVFDLFPPWAEMAPVVQASAQIFIRTVLLQALLATSCIAAARIGPLDIAAHQVALQLWIPPSFLTEAFSIAAQGLVADALGRGDRLRGRELSQLLIKWGVALGGVLAVFYATAQILQPDVLPRFFTEDQGILDKVHPIVWLIAIMQPINGLVNVGGGVLQGAQDFTYQVLTMGLSALFAGSLFFLLRDEGLTAVWETLLAFQVMRAILFAYRFIEPQGPLSIVQEPGVAKGVLAGSMFRVWGHDKNVPKKKKKKKKRYWFNDL